MCLPSTSRVHAISRWTLNVLPATPSGVVSFHQTQARDDVVHPAKAVFLVDSDCVPSEYLLSELSLPEVQDRVCGKEITDSDAGGLSPVAVVVPCLEFSPSVDVKGQVRLLL